MNNLAVSDSNVVTQATGTLEDLLMMMTTYGEPRVSFIKAEVSGWYCNIDMNTSAIGTAFNIKSDFGKATPMDAALQCWDRLNAALKLMPKCN